MKPAQPSKRIINHKFMRGIIGAIAILMPIIVLILSDKHELTSVSISYWTDSRDIFVGSLIAVGFFLVAYNGTGNRIDFEYLISKVAWLFALCIALFPTDGFTEEDIPAGWILNVSEFLDLTPDAIHKGASILLFICLFFLILFFSCRAKEKGKRIRSYIYLAIGMGMLIGMPAVYFIGKGLQWNDTIFWVEFVGLWLFGWGWFIAGSYRTESPARTHLNQLAVGESKVIEVDPGLHNFPTGLKVENCEHYAFEAAGCWRDWFITCGPKGWGAKWNPLTVFNRQRFQPFFVLCGNVGKNDEHAFSIGEECSWAVSQIGKDLDDSQLYLFANDWYCAYGNNKKALDTDDCHPLRVTITRLS
jgi:hypothetical protein